MANNDEGLTPYNVDGFAQTHDDIYLTSPINLGHFKFEVDVIENLLRSNQIDSWCDVACGTGKHIREIAGPDKVARFGIDVSPKMLEVAKLRSGYPVKFYECDVLEVNPIEAPYDLVTHLWYGYIHQASLSDVMSFLNKCAAMVKPGGSLLLGICDPLDLFETVHRSNKLVYGGSLEIEALTWSFEEPWSGLSYKDCIAPHPVKILDELSPQFEGFEVLSYPQLDVPGSWNRKAIMWNNRKA